MNELNQIIKCSGDDQKVTLVKNIDGVPTIVRKHYKDTKVSELNQNTAILNDMMWGSVMSRPRALIQHDCAKMPTRISDIRKALEAHGLTVFGKTTKLPSGKTVKNYSLSPETINRIEKL